MNSRSRRLPSIKWIDRAHGWVYTEWFYLYVALAKWARPLVQAVVDALGAAVRGITWAGRGDADAVGNLMAESVHGKVLTLEHARQLIEIDHAVDLRGLEQVIPYSQARDIVIQNPAHIAVVDCPCRVARGRRACQPIDVCMIIGEPFASRFVVAHPGRARRIDVGEAIAIIESEHRRGHVQHAFFKDAMLGRLYAVCNCCSCCCGPMDYFRHGMPLLASSGYVARAHLEKCTKCGDCAGSCQFGALTFDSHGPHISIDLCMGCGICASRCAHDALVLVREPRRGEPLALRELLPKACDPA